MSQDLDNLVEQKVSARLRAIDQKKESFNIQLRFILALLGAGAGYWLFSKTGAEENFFWFLGVGAALGFLYELLQLALALGVLIILVKCVA
jgi:hypothetical protein